MVKTGPVDPQGTSSAPAKLAWDTRFPSRHVELRKDEPDPFVTKRGLGYGGSGHVYEIELGGIPVALKKTKRRKLGPEVKKELEILKHISTGGHRHIVQLIGSYMFMQKRRGFYELGVIIWPVAPIDLAQFIRELDVLGQYIRRNQIPEPKEELDSAIQDLAIAMDLDPADDHVILFDTSLRRLCTAFGCISNAVLWLHDTAHVRHSDLKPSQVLVSCTGLWLTDFGTSKQIEDLDHTVTTGRDEVTVKYQAPERALGKPRGRAEDVFALGCVYLEMTWVLYGLSVRDIRTLRHQPPNAVGDMKWSYAENIRDQLQDWIAKFSQLGGQRTTQLAGLLEAMLSLDPIDRPPMRAVVDRLVVQIQDGLTFFSACCTPGTPKAFQMPPVSNLRVAHREDHGTMDVVADTRPKSTFNEHMYHHGYHGAHFYSPPQSQDAELLTIPWNSLLVDGSFRATGATSPSCTTGLSTTIPEISGHFARLDEPAMEAYQFQAQPHHPYTNPPSWTIPPSFESPPWSTYPLSTGSMLPPQPRQPVESVDQSVNNLTSSQFSEIWGPSPRLGTSIYSDAVTPSLSADLPSNFTTDGLTDPLWLYPIVGHELEGEWSETALQSFDNAQAGSQIVAVTHSEPRSTCLICNDVFDGTGQEEAPADHLQLMHDESPHVSGYMDELGRGDTGLDEELLTLIHWDF